MSESASVGRLIKGTELRELLGVSRVSLWNWQKMGMPVASSGQPGRENEYDLEQVVRWLRMSGAGQTLRGGAIEAFSRIAKIERATSTPIAASEAPKRVQPIVERVIGNVFANCLVSWSAFVVAKHGLAADLAVDLFEDVLMFVLASAAAELGAEDLAVIFTGAPEEALSPEGRAALLERVEREACLWFVDPDGTLTRSA